MDKNRILNKLSDIKLMLDSIQNEILILEKELNSNNENSIHNDKNINFDDIVPNYSLLSNFIEYLINIKHLKENSIRNYKGDLRNIKVKFKEFLSIDIPFEIYEIDDIKIISKLISLFKENKDFINLNLHLHHSLSAALNNYLSFLSYKSSDFIFDED